MKTTRFLWWFHEQSFVIFWVSWCQNKCFWKRFTCKSGMFCGDMQKTMNFFFICQVWNKIEFCQYYRVIASITKKIFKNLNNNHGLRYVRSPAITAFRLYTMGWIHFCSAFSFPCNNIFFTVFGQPTYLRQDNFFLKKVIKDSLSARRLIQKCLWCFSSSSFLTKHDFHYLLLCQCNTLHFFS